MIEPKNPRTDPRVDELAGTLARSQPSLDDLARARIGASLAALAAAPAPVDQRGEPRRSGLRGPLLGATAALAVAAALLLLWRASLPSDSRPAPSLAQSDRAAREQDSAPSLAPPRPNPSKLQQPLHLPGGARVTFVMPTEAHVKSSATESVIRFDHGAIRLEAAADTGTIHSTEVSVGQVTIYATHATFAAHANADELRLQVERGEVWVSTVSGAQRQRVRAPTTRIYPRAKPAAAAPRKQTVRVVPTPSPEPSRPRPIETAPAPDAPPVPSPASAETAYRAAEKLIAAGKLKSGQQALQKLVRDYPTDRRADAARYDLARIAHRGGENRRARVLLDVLLTNQRDPIVVEPARYLLCKIYLDDRAPQAAVCLRDFRRQFPRSSHDADLLAQLAVIEAQRGGCSVTRTLYSEYLRRYPRGAYAARAGAALKKCGREQR